MSLEHREIPAAQESAYLTYAHAAERGDIDARDRLFVLLYDELRRMAKREVKRSRTITLSATTLLHETFLNIARRDSVPFSERDRFMGYAARAMRGLVVDCIRRRRAQKRGGELEHTDLPTDLPIDCDDNVDVEKLNEALDALSKFDARLAECVDLKFFCGFSFTEIAHMKNTSARTIQRDWKKAQLLLNRYITSRESRE